MATYTVTNIYGDGSQTLSGGSSDDRLVYNYTIPDTGVSTGWFAGTLASGYSGVMDGSSNNNAWFAGMEHFTFTTSVIGDDRITTGDGNDIINTGAGNDWINSQAGNDQIDGGSGNDTWQANHGGSIYNFNINLNGVSNFLTGGTVRNIEAMRLTTGSGNDALTGHATSGMVDDINTGSGNDTITMHIGGEDTVNGGTGDDRLIVTNGLGDGLGGVVTGWWNVGSDDGYSGVFDGNGSNNVWFNNIEHFTFTDLSNGNDNIVTGSGNDSLIGGGGDDTLNSESGYDTVDGGAGSDHWVADQSGLAALNINLNTTSSLPGNGSVRNMEGFNLTTGSGNDTITGHASSGRADTVRSNDGADQITMWLGGEDTVDGGDGEDRLSVTVNLGSDFGGVTTGWWNVGGTDGNSGVFDGYGGNNLWFNNINHFTFIDQSEGNDNITTGAGNDSLIGGAGNDTLNSGSGHDSVDGGDGEDLWIADHSAETTAYAIDLNEQSSLTGGGWVRNMEGFRLNTGSGNDTIRGFDDSAYADTLNTGGGDDMITMHLGHEDTINGGTGSDRLYIINDLGVDFGGVSTGWWNVGSEDGNSGVFDGFGGNNTWFDNINHFTFIDQSEGNDNIRTGAGNDSVIGGGGDDVLNTGSGYDTVDGGAGNDYWHADHSAESTSLNIDLNRSSNLPGNGEVENMEGFNFSAGSGNDTLTGHSSSGMSDTVNSNDGDDQILMTLGGEDSVNGGEGSDRLTLNIEMGAGVSTGWWNVGSDDGYSGVYDGIGSNNVWFNNIDHFTINDRAGGNDILITGAGNDAVSAGAGDDVINASGGADTLDGGDGSDHWIGNFDGSAIALDIDLNGSSSLQGNGSVQNFEGMNLVGTAGNDSFTGHQTGARSDRVEGRDGNDTFRMWQGGEDSIYGGQGTDTLHVTDALGLGDVSFGWLSSDATGYSGVVDGVGSNNIWFYGIENFSFTDGSDIDNHFTTGGANDTVNAEGGNDWINTDGGNDSLRGGAGDDTLIGGAGNDTFDGGSGTDQAVINADSTSATYAEVVGGVQVTTSDGVDLVRNTVETVVFNDRAVAYSEIAGTSNNPPTGGVGVTGQPVAGATLTANTDTLDDADGLGDLTYQWLRDGVVINGATGDTYELTQDDIGSQISVEVRYTDDLGTDEEVTSTQTDEIAPANLNLTGTPGNDTLDGGIGDDRIDALGGNDVLRGYEGADTLLGGDGVDTLIGGDGDDHIFGGATEADLRDVVYGGDGNDSVEGGYGNDELRGDAGNDTLAGGFGADTMIGGTGDDVVTGSAWGDLLYGGDGNDFINGGFGFDRTNGGAGADRFYHMGIADHGSDWIQDYTAADGDVLMYGGGAASASDFLVQRAATPNAGEAGVDEVFVTHIPSGNLLWALVDGDAQTQINVLAGGVTFDLLA